MLLIDLKLDRSATDENIFFSFFLSFFFLRAGGVLGLTFSSKLDWGSCISSLTKTSSNQLESGLFYKASLFCSCALPAKMKHPTFHEILLSYFMLVILAATWLLDQLQ